MNIRKIAESLPQKQVIVTNVEITKHKYCDLTYYKDNLSKIKQQIKNKDFENIEAECLKNALKTIDSVLTTTKVIKDIRYELEDKSLYTYFIGAFKGEQKEFVIIFKNIWLFNNLNSSFKTNTLPSLLANNFIIQDSCIVYYLPIVENLHLKNQYPIWVGTINQTSRKINIDHNKVLKIELANKEKAIKHFFTKKCRNRINYLETCSITDEDLKHPYFFDRLKEINEPLSADEIISVGINLEISGSVRHFNNTSIVKVMLVLGKEAVFNLLLNSSSSIVKEWSDNLSLSNIDQEQVIKKLFCKEQTLEQKTQQVISRLKDGITTTEIKQLGLEPGKLFPKLRKQGLNIKKTKINNHEYKYTI